MSTSPGSLWKNYSSLTHRRRWGENKIIGRFHSPLVKSRHKLKGRWGKQASEIWKQKRTVRKTQRVAVGSVGRGAQLPSHGGLGMGGARSAIHRNNPRLGGIWDALREYLTVSVGTAVRSWDLGQVCTCTSIWDPPGFWCFSFLVKLGKARITAQLGSPLPRSHEHNYVHHFLWIKQQRRTPGALEELGWEAGMLGLHWIPGPWVEFRGSINLDVKIILLCFHCCPAETEHFLHLWMFQPAPGVIAESRTLSPREITGSLKPQDS